MGFYGNINNINKSTFQFDKIYPNKATMEDFCANDEVFIGRYVLVDYNLDQVSSDAAAVETIPGTNVIIGYRLRRAADNEICYYNIGGPVLYSGANSGTPAFTGGNFLGGNTVTEGSYILVVGEIYHEETVIRPPTGYVVEQGPEIVETDTFAGIPGVLYQCESIEEGGIPLFVEVTKAVNLMDKYGLNLAIDSDRYGTIGRGWDSTVWQKVYRDGVPTYVMIAELNSVVPTFDLAAEAPTATPLLPHWDTESSGVYYKLHVQPQWGVRIKQSVANTYTSDTLTYPSDISGKFVRQSYLNDAGKLVTDEITTPLAIYFNKNGFNKNIESTIAGDLARKKITANASITNAGIDAIKLQPTGYSGNKYNYHDGSGYHVNAKRPDTFELSVLLPSFGTAVSEMWNLVYGPGASRDVKTRYLWNKETGLFATETNNKVDITNALRNTNIAWNNINGVRLVTDNDGNGNFVYNPDSMDSLAASINTAHDLIGQIIIDNEQSLNNVANWDPTRIYYINKKFYRKKKSYNYTASSTIYKQVNDVVADTTFNNYYRQEINEFPSFSDEKTVTAAEKALEKTQYSNYIKYSNEGKYIEGAKYFSLATTQSPLSTTEPAKNLTVYKKDASGSFMIPSANERRAGEYFTLSNIRQVEGAEFYVPGRYYIAIALSQTNIETNVFTRVLRCTDMSLAGALAAADNPQYYQFFRNVKVIENYGGGYVEDKSDPILRKDVPWPTNSAEYSYNSSTKKLTLKTTDGSVIATLPSGAAESVDAVNRTYTSYTYKVSENTDSWTLYEIAEKGYTVINENGKPAVAYNLKQGEATITYSLQDAIAIPSLIEFRGDINYYFLNGGNYILETWENLNTYYGSGGDGLSRNTLDSNNKIAYYTLTPNSIGVFYSLTTPYYYKDTGNNWRRETALRLSLDDTGIENRYYTLTTTQITARPFSSGTFYTNLNGTVATTFTSPLYEKVGGFVVSDSSGVYKKGTEWNSKATTVPSTVTLGTRTVVWKAEELKGFTKNLNTILGLILKINDVLSADDEYTRDLSTVQGCINSMHDILHRFDQLTPGEIVTVDSYGKIHSASLSTAQKGTYENWGTGATNLTISNAENRWIQVDVSSETNTQTIKVNHKLGFKARNTTSSLDLNTTSDNFTILSPIVDSNGHIIGKDTKTITLPYNFRTVKIGSANSGTAVLTHAAGSLEANTRSDTLTINSGNKWMLLAAATNTDTVTIAHSAGLEAKTVGDSSNQTPGFGDTFKVPYVGRDEAGHITTLTEHTVKIPAINLNNIKLSGYSSGTAGTIAATDSVNTAFSKLQNSITTLNANSSTKGSVAKAVNDAISTEVTNRNTAIQAAVTDIRLQAWPVGSIFITVAQGNPATILGGGTWEQVATGRFLLGADSNHSADSNGGDSIELNYKNIPAHQHRISTTSSGSIANPGVKLLLPNGFGATNESSSLTAFTTNDQSDSQPESFTPAYFAAYLWKRTA